ALRVNRTTARSRVLADRIQIQQCLINLLTNSFDAAAQDGSRAPEVAISIEGGGRAWIQVSVRDNGAGVDPAVANRLFEPFFTTKPKGVGLGLLVTKSIVEGHGGKIWFAPNPEGGTTFSFTLPSINATDLRARGREAERAIKLRPI